VANVTEKPAGVNRPPTFLAQPRYRLHNLAVAWVERLKGGKLGEIIQTIAIFAMGIAAGYTWRDRISKARRAKEREQRERRRRRQTTAVETTTVANLIGHALKLHEKDSPA
jgi:hypothetical protein